MRSCASYFLLSVVLFVLLGTAVYHWNVNNNISFTAKRANDPAFRKDEQLTKNAMTTVGTRTTTESTREQSSPPSPTESRPEDALEPIVDVEE